MGRSRSYIKQKDCCVFLWTYTAFKMNSWGRIFDMVSSQVVQLLSMQLTDNKQTDILRV